MAEKTLDEMDTADDGSALDGWEGSGPSLPSVDTEYVGLFIYYLPSVPQAALC